MSASLSHAHVRRARSVLWSLLWIASLWLSGPHPRAASLPYPDPQAAKPTGKGATNGKGGQASDGEAKGGQAQDDTKSKTHGVIVPDRVDPGRRLRGDYEPIDLLMLVHDDTWMSSLEAIIEGVGDRVPIEVLVEDAKEIAPRYARVREGRCVDVQEAAHDTPWIRDYGPLQVSDGARTVWLDLAYGADRGLDDGIPEFLGERFGSELAFEPAQLDGGGIVSNGRGLCAVTDLSLFESGLELQDREVLYAFAGRLGCAALAVVPALPDEQTGHTDVSIQFLAEDKVAVAWMAPDDFPLQSSLLDRTVEVLELAARRLGQPLDVVRVPMTARGEVFYSYLNGTRVGDLFLVPRYDRADPKYQEAAYAILAAHMEGVTLVPIAADEMVELGGAIHCITLGLSLPPRAKPRCGERPHQRRVRKAPPPHHRSRKRG